MFTTSQGSALRVHQESVNLTPAGQINPFEHLLDPDFEWDSLSHGESLVMTEIIPEFWGDCTTCQCSSGQLEWICWVDCCTFARSTNQRQADTRAHKSLSFISLLLFQLSQVAAIVGSSVSKSSCSNQKKPEKNRTATSFFATGSCNFHFRK